MKLRSYLLLAAISALLLGAGRAETSRRPRYGGTLRVEIGAVIHSLDPVESTPDPEEAAVYEKLFPIFRKLYYGLGEGEFREALPGLRAIRDVTRA